MMRIAACLALVPATLGALSARAETSPLEWQYECLKAPDAVCFDATPSGSDPLPPVQETKAPPAAVTGSHPAGEPAAPPSRPAKAEPTAPKATPGDAASSDPLATIAAHLQVRKANPADIAALQARARTGNARALELLAWAELVGVGVPRDPVQSYFHYGMAAAAGMPNGRRDQAAIFEGSLTAEQRQQILVIENGNIAGKPPSP